MGMGKKAPPSQPYVPTPTVEQKSTVDAQAVKNSNSLARVEDNKSATLLQVKDDEELKRIPGVG